MLYNLAWGGFKNGEIPASLLVTVRGELFEREAGLHLLALEGAFDERFGDECPILEGYRPMARQDYLWAGWVHQMPGFHLAARPGTSNHGWARACDFAGGVDVFGSAQKIWMDANAPRFGWWPTGNGFEPREAWHYDYRPGTATISTAALGSIQLEDDDMKDDERAALFNIENALMKGGPGMPDVNRSLGLSAKVQSDALYKLTQALPLLQDLHDATFSGGPSMEDANRSVSRSLKAHSDQLTAILAAVGVRMTDDQGTPLSAEDIAKRVADVIAGRLAGPDSAP